MSDAKTVTIVCISYNQEKFIKQTIEGFLLQKTNFKYEVLISDDASTDNTAKIILNYAKKYPKIIRPTIRKKNVGGLINFTKLLSKATGTYITICEGDDYWTNPRKLQKQVDYLDAHPSCSMCFHAASILNFDGKISSKKLLPATNNKNFYTPDLVIQNSIPTLTCVFRNCNPLPEWFYRVFPSDWPLHILNSLSGYAYYMTDDMATYRLNQQSMTHKLSFPYKQDSFIHMMKTVKSDCLPDKYKRFADISISKLQIDYALFYLSADDKKNALRRWALSIKTYCSPVTVFSQAIVLYKLLKIRKATP